MYYALREISIWIILLPLVVGILLHDQLSTNSKIILLLVLVGLPPQLTSDYISETSRNILYNTYTPIEFFILYFFFRRQYSSQLNKTLFVLTVPLYLIVTAVILINEKSIENRFIGEWVSVNNLVYMIWILLYFRDQYLLPNLTFSFNNSFSWALLGLFIYAACTPLHFVLYDRVKRSYLSAFQSSFNILLYIFFTIGFYKDKMLKDKLAQKTQFSPS
jgi:hypothetical protein